MNYYFLQTHDCNARLKAFHEIPKKFTSVNITFTYNGREYKGILSKVQGAGDTRVYHLMIDGYYKGRLRLSAFDQRWIFDGEFADLADGFGLWLQVLPWVKSEFDSDEEGIFYFLTYEQEDESFQ